MSSIYHPIWRTDATLDLKANWSSYRKAYKEEIKT